MAHKDEASTRHEYRRTAGYEMDERKLLLRGGTYDGLYWTGVIGIGKRVFCGGDDAWSTEGMYLVTDRWRPPGRARRWRSPFRPSPSPGSSCSEPDR